MISKQQDEYYKIFLDQQQWHYIGQEENHGIVNYYKGYQNNRMDITKIFLGQSSGTIQDRKKGRTVPMPSQQHQLFSIAIRIHHSLFCFVFGAFDGYFVGAKKIIVVG